MKKVTWLLALVSVLLVTPRVTATEGKHITVTLAPIDNPSITGAVRLEQIPAGGTKIYVTAQALEPDTDYIALYYENHTCTQGPPSEYPSIGTFTTDVKGNGWTLGGVGAELDQIKSVSVQRASDFILVACADVYPIPEPGVAE